MGDVVTFPNLVDDDELVENLARFADGTLTEAQVKARHHLSAEQWAAMGTDDKLVELVEACKLRRIRGGRTKRERAQIEIVDAAPILGKIMRDPDANERHVIDSIKVLDGLATGGSEGSAPASDRFQIVINLTADGSDTIEHYDKSIKIDPDDSPAGMIAAITKKTDGGGGEQGYL